MALHRETKMFRILLSKSGNRTTHDFRVGAGWRDPRDSQASACSMWAWHSPWSEGVSERDCRGRWSRAPKTLRSALWVRPACMKRNISQIIQQCHFVCCLLLVKIWHCLFFGLRLNVSRFLWVVKSRTAESFANPPLWKTTSELNPEFSECLISILVRWKIGPAESDSGGQLKMQLWEYLPDHCW